MAIDVQEVAGLTAEDVARLSAPFPKEVIKSFQGKGGKEMRYIDVHVLEARVAEVDRNWGKTVTPGSVGVAVHYTIKGVTRGDMYDNDSESNKYGAPQVNALARASRRALREFGVGEDMWEDDEVETAKDIVSKKASPAAKSGQSGPSANQIAWLTTGSDDKPGLGVPKKVVMKLTAGRDGTASKLMDALFAARRENGKAYKSNPTPFIREALRDIDKKLVSLLGDDDDDEAYEDDDED